jgi:hypothetical protein
MFETLDEEIRATEGGEERSSSRMLRFVLIAAVSVVVFGAVVAGIAMLE